jgi:hypothetical protein
MTTPTPRRETHYNQLLDEWLSSIRVVVFVVFVHVFSGVVAGSVVE